ncbi:MAG TPA: methyltransferase domain-containing protein [Candidatus Saccharimonadales bacterium]|nr:methyltransferase domain-containing protein [Candidatus Saccharimonadales bacterium]
MEPPSSSGPDTSELRSEVQKLYGRVAQEPGGEFHFHRGAEYAVTALGYDRADLARIPESSLRSFAGAANPHVIDPLRPGEVVLDVGCGAGTDLLLAAQKVGPGGRAIGVDLTAAMLEQCRASVATAGVKNVELRSGDAEHIPVGDGEVDAVISNGVLNMVPDKERAFREIFRVLRPGGRLLLGDIAVTESTAEEMRCNVALWTG